MAGISTVAIWDAIKGLVEGLDRFAFVSNYPLDQVTSDDFIDNIPDVVFPAALIVFLGARGVGDSAPRKQVLRFSIMVCREDLAGDAYRAAVADVDLITGLLGQDLAIDGQSCWLMGSYDVGVGRTPQRRSLYEVTIEVRQDVTELAEDLV